MEKLINLIHDIEERKLLVTNGKKGEQIQQTQRNAMKKEILEALFEDIKSEYDFVYHSNGEDEKGILLEIANQSIANQVTNEDGSGAITIALDVKILGLKSDAELSEELYQHSLEVAREKKKEAEAKKAAKIARDEAERKRKHEEIEKKKAELAKAKKEKEGEGEE